MSCGGDGKSNDVQELSGTMVQRSQVAVLCLECNAPQAPT